MATSIIFPIIYTEIFPWSLDIPMIKEIDPWILSAHALGARENFLDIITIGFRPNISEFSPHGTVWIIWNSSFSAGVGFDSDFLSDYLLLLEKLKSKNLNI